MGLTLHYDLHAPPLATIKSRRAFVTDLRAFAASLRLNTCSRISHWNARRDDPRVGDFFHLFHPLDNDPNSDNFLSVPPLDITFFQVRQPGSETASFGLGQFADTAPHFRDPAVHHHTHLTGSHWHSFCKTQYASLSQNGGWDNFFKIHDGICRILDHAHSLGAEVNVRDDGDYWPNRDADALRKQIDHWNNLIAAFTGRLKDAFPSKDDGAIIAPITTDPAFEHMEAKGQKLFRKKRK